MPQPQIVYGHYTSDGNPRVVEVPSGITKFEIFNQTNVASTANPGVVKRAWWQEGLADGSYFGVKNTDGAATDESTTGTTDGFTPISTGLDNQLEGAQTGTAITAASPAVVTLNSHGYSVGDVVRLTNTTGMLQIAGMDFTVTAVGGANNFTLGYLDASGFAAAATAVTARRLRYENIYAPRNRFVTNISQAASAVITLSVAHEYVVGEIVKFKVPAEFGMTEIDGVQGQITAVTASTVTVDIDSSGFTAFAFPASAAIGTFAQMYPVGQDSSIVSAPFTNTGFVGMHLGADVVGATSDVVRWEAHFGYEV